MRIAGQLGVCLWIGIFGPGRPSAEEVSFLGAREFAAALGVGALAIGDFNGDGIRDVAVTNSSGLNISIFIGNGDGTFQSALPVGAGTHPNSIAIGDFNRDGIQDLAVTGSGNVSVLIGLGNGTFQPPVDYATIEGPHSLVIGDFNRDGFEDLALAHLNGIAILITFSGTRLKESPWAISTGTDFRIWRSRPFPTSPSCSAMAMDPFGLRSKIRLAREASSSRSVTSIKMGSKTWRGRAAAAFPFLSAMEPGDSHPRSAMQS